MARKTTRDALLHWLGPDHYASRLLTPSRKRLAPTQADWRRFREGNLAGIGFGVKETAGSVTGGLAVRIYLKRKLPMRDLSLRERVPTLVNGFPTDVIAIGTPTFHARPVSFGAGISHARGGQGSLGCVVIKPQDDVWYALSACHVLALGGEARPDDMIVEPSAKNDDGSPNANAAPFAVLVDFEPLRAGGVANTFDAAIARLDQKTDVTADIPLVGSPQAPLMNAVPFQSVHKYGAGTGSTIGIVTDAANHITLTLDDNSYFFSGVIQVIGAGGPFSSGGDSGALVVDALTRRPIGLVIGGVGQRTFVGPIKPALDRFGAQLLQ